MRHHDTVPGSSDVLGAIEPATAAAARPLAVPRDGVPSLPTAVLALSGELLLANDAFLLLLGATADGLVGLPAAQWCGTPEDADILLSVLQDAREGADGGDTALRLRHASGRMLPLRLAWSLVRDAQGTATQLRCVWFRDEALQSTGMLTENEARWRSLLAHAADITWTADADGRILSATAGVLDQLGWQLEQIAGCRAFDFVHPE